MAKVTILAQDAAGTPVLSPKALTVTPQPLLAPPGAGALAISADCAIRYGMNAFLDAAAAAKGYKKAAADAGDIVIPCRGNETIYVRAETGTGMADFYFVGGLVPRRNQIE